MNRNYNMRSIPPGGSIPASVRQRQQPVPTTFKIQKGVKNVPKPSTGTLAKLLEWGKQEEQKCIDLLKVLPPELPEYGEVLSSLDEIQIKLHQIKVQTGRK